MNNEKIPHTFAAFQARYVVENNSRAPGCQESFDAGMRAGRDLQWSERATTASAAPTIRYTLDARRGLVQAAEGEWVWHTDHLAALDARAEESRREAQDRANSAIANHMAHIRELEAKIVQRTAGGAIPDGWELIHEGTDKIMVRCYSIGACTAVRRGREMTSAFLFDLADALLLAAQPVAEAEAEELTEDEVIRVWNSLGGHDRFLKTFSFLHFAQELFRALAAKQTKKD